MLGQCLDFWLTQPNIHVDETPWMVKGVKEWLWIFANTNFALFHAADTRGQILDARILDFGLNSFNLKSKIAVVVFFRPY